MSIIHRLIPLVPSALALALASHAWAQPAQSAGVAHLQHVTGNVLVSKETGLASGSESTVLTRGARVITTANSEVTVVYDNGCEVKLKPNQRFEVDTDKPCSMLQARAESILAEPAAAVAAAGSTGAVVASSGLLVGSSAALPLAAVGGLAGLAALQTTRESQAVSPH